MADLFTQAKAMFPTASDDEINQGIQRIKSEQPDASDDEILQAASKIQTQMKQPMAPEMQQNVVQSYIRQKYGIGEKEGADRQALADEVQKSGSPIAAALAGFGAGLQGKDVASGFKTAFDASQAKAKDKLNQFDQATEKKRKDFAFERDLTGAERQDKEYGDNQAKKEREKDPASEESKLAQSLASRMIPGRDFSKMNADQINTLLPSLTKIYDIEQKKLDRSEARAERAAREQDKRDEKLTRNQEQDLMKLGKDVAGTQDLLGGLDEVEAKLGGKLESFSRDKDGNLVKDGKKVDLPGVSVPGIGRVSAYSSEARELQGAADKIFNTTLKDRSGGAVTDNEMERLKQEFNSGKYNSEPELIDALQRFKRATARVLKNREASFSPAVVDKYKEQGGRTSDSVSGANKTPAKNVVKKQYSQSANKTKIIYDDGSEEIVDGKQ